MELPSASSSCDAGGMAIKMTNRPGLNARCMGCSKAAREVDGPFAMVGLLRDGVVEVQRREGRDHFVVHDQVILCSKCVREAFNRLPEEETRADRAERQLLSRDARAAKAEGILMKLRDALEEAGIAMTMESEIRRSEESVYPRPSETHPGETLVGPNTVIDEEGVLFHEGERYMGWERVKREVAEQVRAIPQVDKVDKKPRDADGNQPLDGQVDMTEVLADIEVGNAADEATAVPEAQAAPEGERGHTDVVELPDSLEDLRAFAEKYSVPFNKSDSKAKVKAKIIEALGEVE